MMKHIDVWVGITEVDGVWWFVTNGAQIYPNQGNTLAQWGEGEPNNKGGNQNCASIWSHNHKLDDDDCGKSERGFFEIEKKNIISFTLFTTSETRIVFIIFDC